MRKTQGGNAHIFLLMCVASVAVTVGVALTLYPAPERSPSFLLSLVMLCFAEAALFIFPVYQGRATADRRAPAFALGLGFQTLLALYAAGVIGLCLLSGKGAIVYDLAERQTLADGISLQSAVVRGQDGKTITFDGREHVTLAQGHALAAGESDAYLLELVYRADSTVSQRLIHCDAQAPVLAISTKLEAEGSETANQGCLGPEPLRLQITDLELRKVLVSGPVVRPGQLELFDLKYRIEVRNTRWFVSFRTLAIAHTILFLLLLLGTGSWRLSSNLATGIAQRQTEQRQVFLALRAKTASFAGNVALAREAVLKPFVLAMKALSDDMAHATPNTLPGTESFDDRLADMLERLGADYGHVRAQLAGDSTADVNVQALVDSARAMATLVKERDAAIRAAR